VSEAFVGALVGGSVAAVLACLGFWITYKTSTAAMQQAMLQNAAIKHADFITQWIKELRDDTALFVKFHQNIMLSRRSSVTGKVPASDRDKLLALAEVRARLKMMIRQDTDHEDEKRFLSLINQDVADNEDDAKQQRLDIIASSRNVQKTAWQIAKSKISNPK
jgi:hypothetical protein